MTLITKLFLRGEEEGPILGTGRLVLGNERLSSFVVALNKKCHTVK